MSTLGKDGGAPSLHDPGPAANGALARLALGMEGETRATHQRVDEMEALAKLYRQERRGLLGEVSRRLRWLWLRLGIRPPRVGLWGRLLWGRLLWGRLLWGRLPRVPYQRRGKVLGELLARHAKRIGRIRARWRVLATASWPARRLRLAIVYFHFRARWARPLLLLVLLLLLLWLLGEFPPLREALGFPTVGEGGPP